MLYEKKLRIATLQKEYDFEMNELVQMRVEKKELAELCHSFNSINQAIILPHEQEIYKRVERALATV